jgi:hypothetical protein
VSGIAWEGGPQRAVNLAFAPGEKCLQRSADAALVYKQCAGMWWLSFRDGSAAVIEATSLSHARTLASVREVGSVGQFVDGHRLSPELAALIPDDRIGRLLSRDDAWQLYDQLARDRSDVASVQERSGLAAKDKDEPQPLTLSATVFDQSQCHPG